jgi:hypothetical protein
MGYLGGAAGGTGYLGGVGGGQLATWIGKIDHARPISVHCFSLTHIKHYCRST